MKINDVEFKIHGIQDKELDSFWKEHGGHYTLCVERHNEGKHR